MLNHVPRNFAQLDLPEMIDTPNFDETVFCQMLEPIEFRESLSTTAQQQVEEDITQDEIDLLVKRLGKTFKIDDQGNLSDYLGIKIERKPDGTLEWTQPTLIQSILKDLKLDGEEIKGRQNKPNIKPVPAHTSVLLTDHRDSPDHNPKDFEYHQVIGKLLVSI